MKKNRLLMLLSAAALLASCGGNSTPASSNSSATGLSASTSDSVASSVVPSSSEIGTLMIEGVTRIGIARSTTVTASETGATWKSSNDTIATVTEDGVVTGVTAGSVTITASKEGFLDASITIDVVPPLNEEGSLSIFEDFFVSEFGTLAVGLDGATYYDYDTDAVIELVPTDLQYVEYSYKVGGLLHKKESLPTLFFGPEYNDTQYRLRLGYGNRKNVVFEKADGDSWVTVDELMPSISEFAGAYNGLGSDYIGDTNNVVYLFSSVFDRLDGGFRIGAYYDSDIVQTSLVNKSYFADVEGQYLKAIDAFDLTDGEFFDMPVIPAEDGLVYLPESLNEDPGLCWFPDFSPILGTLYDELGNEYAFDYGYGTFTDWVTFDEYDAFAINHSEEAGYNFTFTNSENAELELTFTINADYFSVETAEGTHFLGRKNTFFFFDDPDVGADRTFTDGTHTLNLASVFDYETWESEDTFTYDGEVLEDAKLVAFERGLVGLSFSVEADGMTKSYLFISENEYIGSMLDDSDTPTIWFDAPHFTQEYEGEYFTFNKAGEKQTIAISDELKVTVGENTYDGKFAFDTDFNSIVVNYGEENTFLAVDTSIGLYASFSGEAGLVGTYLDTALADKLVGEYVINGETVLTFSEDYRLELKGAAVNYSVAPLSNGDGTYSLALLSADSKYAFVADINGAFTILTNSQEGLSVAGRALRKDHWQSAVGTYVLRNAEGKEEKIILGNDGKLQLSTPNANTGELELVEYDYTFSFDEDGNLELNVITAGGVATFTRESYGFVIGNLVYLTEGYYKIQGTYVNVEEGIVVTVELNKVTVNGVVDSFAEIFFDPDHPVATITLSNGDAVRYDYPSDIYVIYMPKDGAEFNQLEAFQYDLADYVGTWENEGSTFTLELTENGYVMKKDGAFYSSVYTVEIVDGHVCITFRAPFGNVSLYLDGGEVKAIF
ncbi:MAG: Ig-like domain-containing protein, partial [Bacilli bacterium]|nr:Ig-like domain-containing protein [Bacilli bacterium]